MRTFKLTERAIQPGCHQIEVEGEVDLAVADELKDALERAATEHDQILIGLQRCEFIDSTAIAVIVHVYNQMTTQGKRVAVHGPSGQVHRVLSITGLVHNGLVFETADEALEVPAGNSRHEEVVLDGGGCTTPFSSSFRSDRRGRQALGARDARVSPRDPLG